MQRKTIDELVLKIVVESVPTQAPGEVLSKLAEMVERNDASACGWTFKEMLIKLAEARIADVLAQRLLSSMPPCRACIERRAATLKDGCSFTDLWSVRCEIHSGVMLGNESVASPLLIPQLDNDLMCAQALQKDNDVLEEQIRLFAGNT